jgi:hypothetical protein
MGDLGISGENPFEVAQLVSDLYPGVSPDPGMAERFDEQTLFGKQPAPPIAVTIAAIVAAEVVASPTRVRLNLTRILAVGKHTRHGNRVVLQTVRTARNTAWTTDSIECHGYHLGRDSTVPTRIRTTFDGVRVIHVASCVWNYSATELSLLLQVAESQ